MYYTIKVTIANPNTPADMASDIHMELNAYFSHDPDTYGNGYYLAIKGDRGFSNYYDIRYDRDFDPNLKIGYLEQWAKGYWTGKNGAYAIKYLCIATATD